MESTHLSISTARCAITFQETFSDTSYGIRLLKIVKGRKFLPFLGPLDTLFATELELSILRTDQNVELAMIFKNFASSTCVWVAYDPFLVSFGKAVLTKTIKVIKHAIVLPFVEADVMEPKGRAKKYQNALRKAIFILS